jgi:hypothetical protein
MKDLSVYLNDHLAGSVGALEMLDGLIQTHESKPLEAFLTQLRRDIESDQNELKVLIKRIGIDESAMRKAGAWMMEKLSRTKLGLGGSGDPKLALLQSLETLALGITGKRSLWRTLAAAGEGSRLLQGIDFARLEARAVDQIERVESQGLKIARQIFGPELNAGVH